MRTSVVPTVHGEKTVMRLLDKTKTLISMKDLGMLPSVEAPYMQMAKSPLGMILCTGPTGSGKTTTLYATLTEVNDATKNVVTIEDPVEYQFEGVTQMQVTDTGMSFADGMREEVKRSIEHANSVSADAVEEARKQVTARGRESVLATALTALAFAGRPLPLESTASAVVVSHGPRVIRRSPVDGGHPGEVVLVAYRDNPGGTGVDPGQVRFVVGGRDVTAAARVTSLGLQVATNRVGPRPATAVLLLTDRAGNSSRTVWTIGR